MSEQEEKNRFNDSKSRSIAITIVSSGKTLLYKSVIYIFILSYI